MSEGCGFTLGDVGGGFAGECVYFKVYNTREGLYFMLGMREAAYDPPFVLLSSALLPNKFVLSTKSFCCPSPLTGGLLTLECVVGLSWKPI